MTTNRIKYKRSMRSHRFSRLYRFNKVTQAIKKEIQKQILEDLNYQSPIMKRIMNK
jgi:predicted transcriptional regulator